MPVSVRSRGLEHQVRRFQSEQITRQPGQIEGGLSGRDCGTYNRTMGRCGKPCGGHCVHTNGRLKTQAKIGLKRSSAITETPVKSTASADGVFSRRPHQGLWLSSNECL